MLGQAAEDWLNYLTGPAALLVFLLVVIWTGIKRYWVFGWVYDQALAEVEELKRANRDLRNLGFTAASAAESSVNVAERIAQRKIEEMAREVEEARRRGLIQ